jgi:hypothetical protein
MATPAIEPAAEIVTSQASLCGWYGATLLLLAIIVVTPVWVVDYPPLVDYPNHLARGYILSHFGESNFRDYLEIDNRPIPNLAVDFFLIAAKPFCDVRRGGKLFLTLTLWLVLFGWHLLGSAIHGKPTWLALGGALAVYHSMFLYGFVNFSFCLGMYLVTIAAWLSWRGRWNWWRVPVVVLLALGCYFSHLAALIFLWGTALAVTFWEVAINRKFSLMTLVDLAPLFVPFGLFLWGGGGGGAAPIWNWRLKLVGALCLFRGYNRHLDAGYIAAVAIFLILLGIWSSRVRANGSTLFTGLGCVAMFLIGPYEIFGGMPADARFLPAAAALITLSLDLTIPLKKALALFGMFLALVVFRYAMIAAYWESFQPDLLAQVELMQSLPTKAKVYPIVHVPEQPEEQKLATASFHLIQYAVIDRQIYSPHHFAFAGQQPIRYKTQPIAFHSSAEYAPSILDAWPKIAQNYDYLWCLNLPEFDRRFLQRQCDLVAESGNASIWRLKKH